MDLTKAIFLARDPPFICFSRPMALLTSGVPA